MKRNSFLITRRGGASGTGRLLAAILGLILLVLLVVRLVAPGTLTNAAAPLWRAGDGLVRGVEALVPVTSRAKLLDDRARLVAENEEFRNRERTLAARVADLERLLGGRTNVGGDETLASVLAHPPIAPYDTLVLDRGVSDGIAVGDRVLGRGGIPIGTVTQASRGSAHAELFSSNGRSTQAWLGETRTPLELVGASAGAFTAELPVAAGAAVGDTVFVSGAGALPLGTVSGVVSDPASPTVVLRIRPNVNPFSLTWVTIAPAL